MDDQQYPFDEELSTLETIGIYVCLMAFTAALGYAIYILA